MNVVGNGRHDGETRQGNLKRPSPEGPRAVGRVKLPDGLHEVAEHDKINKGKVWSTYGRILKQPLPSGTLKEGAHKTRR